MTSVVSPSLVDEYEAFLRNDPSVLENPYPLFKRLREEAPVFRHATHVALTRYEDVAAVMGDRTGKFLVGYGEGLTTGAVQAGLAAAQSEGQRDNFLLVWDYLNSTLSSMNGAQHDRVRAVAHAAFTPKVIKRTEEAVQELIDELLAPVASRGHMDLVADLVWQFPLMVICRMLDVPLEDRHQLREWAMQLAAAQLIPGAEEAHLDAYDTAAKGARGLQQYAREQFALRRAATGETTDLMSSMLASAEEGRVSEDELMPVIAQLIFGGHETTANLLSNACYALLGEYRDQWDLICEDPARAALVVDETLRYDCSVTFLARTASQDCEIGGVEIKQWDTIRPGVAAANHDPSVFPDPERFDIFRDRSKHLGLGIGAHYCLGSSLARLEVTLLARTLATRFPDMKVDGTPLRDTTTHILRGFRSLPVRFSAG